MDLQLDAMWEMVGHVDGQCGGEGKGWMQIACSAQEARRIIEGGRLAVVLAVEVDSLGNWRTPADLPPDRDEARLRIREELERLHDRGVRLITPIHLTDNAFGGAAIYNRLFDALNVRVTGQHFVVEDASASGIEYRLEDDSAGGGIVGFLKRRLAYGCLKSQSHPSHATPGGHANARGLTDQGRILLEEMTRLAMVIDIDHMSQKSAGEALEIAEAVGYPVVASHAAFRELSLSARETSSVEKLATEGLQTAHTLERIRALGGLVAPILYQRDLKSHGDRIANDCAGSSKSWAQAYLYAVEKMGGQGVALGTDVNGLALLPGPRFGTHAAHGLTGDEARKGRRRAQIDAQRGGVRYEEALRDCGRHRWEGETDSGYTKREAWTFQAIAVAEREEDLDRAVPDRPAAAVPWIANIAVGLRATSIDELLEPGAWYGGYRASAARTQRGAFHARAGTDPLDIEDPRVRRICGEVAPILGKWREMGEGRQAAAGRPSLSRSVAGQRDFDVNIDGVAHYGLLPDLVEDLRNIGLSDEDLAPLRRSAEHFVRMWEKCEQRGGAPAL